MAAPHYPWREGNRFELMMDGDCFFPHLLEAMRQARSSIDIELYLVESGTSLDKVSRVLLDAVGRGVRVRCLFDGAGSGDLREEDRQRLRDGGIDLHFYNPLNLWGGRTNLHRDHRKLIIVDQQRAYIGGAGFTDDFCIPDDAGNCRWHEQMLKVQGPVVADWVGAFAQQWQVSHSRRGWTPALPRKVRVPPPPAAGDGLARVSLTDGRSHRELLHALLANIARAQHKVWLATPYFVPGWRLRRALVRAARRGVDVRLLLCGEITDHPAVRYAGQRFYRRLLKAGVRIHEYQPRFLHLKTVLVDDWVSLGSANFDRWTLHWNLEANLNIIDRGMSHAVERSFSTDFAQSREWTLVDWLNLPRRHKLKVRLWGAISRRAMFWLGIH